MKTSVYVPDELGQVAKDQGLNMSKLFQRALIEAVTWGLTPGPVRYYDVTGATMADIITLMTEADIPLNARFAVRHEHGKTPAAYIEWKEHLPQEANGDGSTQNHGHSDQE